MTAGGDAIDWLVRAAVEEDVGAGDFTSLWTLPPDQHAQARVVAKEPAIVAGTDPFVSVFHLVDPSVEVELLVEDGASVETETVVIRLSGPAVSLLTAERVALNFLGRLSGIATFTRRFVEALSGTGARVVDTRKTTPGWRLLEKAAVRAGGGSNHRLGLYDMVLIKDNHIDAAGGIGEAIRAVKRSNERGLPIEVEVADLDGLEEALGEGVDRILLDNMTPDEVAEAVGHVRRRRGPNPELEASGNVTLATVRSYGEAGVDFISVGALTHSAPSADFSMRMGR
ncbi:MAG: carboxylating nicotinate-nucleotide diphosphorylase [Longimicrobiales bacterium]